MENKKIKNATPKVYNGVEYRSTLEANCAKILNLQGISFTYEPFKIEYIPTFKYKGVTFRKAQYTPDFVVDNKYILEVKGFPNSVYPYKKKLILLTLMKDNKYSFYEIHSTSQLKKWITLYKNNTLQDEYTKDFI